jgi:hypothetical protein
VPLPEASFRLRQTTPRESRLPEAAVDTRGGVFCTVHSGPRLLGVQIEAAASKLGAGRGDWTGRHSGSARKVLAGKATTLTPEICGFRALVSSVVYLDGPLHSEPPSVCICERRAGGVFGRLKGLAARCETPGFASLGLKRHAVDGGKATTRSMASSKVSAAPSRRRRSSSSEGIRSAIARRKRSVGPRSEAMA